MKQRVYILFLLPALIFAYSLSGAGSIKEAMRSRPNVVIILADDMGMGDLGFLNGGTSSTPTLDALARTGIWFSNGYSASPVCAPARAALLTGRIPHRSNVVTLDIMKYPELTTLSSAEVTMAEVFREAGYRTGLVGKWHTSHRPESHPLRAGFEVF
jgi:arylsulfatase A